MNGHGKIRSRFVRAKSATEISGYSPALVQRNNYVCAKLLVSDIFKNPFVLGLDNCTRCHRCDINGSRF